MMKFRISGYRGRQRPKLQLAEPPLITSTSKKESTATALPWKGHTPLSNVRKMHFRAKMIHAHGRISWLDGMYNEVIWLRAQMAIGTHSVVGSCHVKPRLAAAVQHSGFDRFPFLTDTQVHGALHGKEERGMITWPQGGERWSVDSSSVGCLKLHPKK